MNKAFAKRYGCSKPAGNLAPPAPCVGDAPQASVQSYPPAGQRSRAAARLGLGLKRGTRMVDPHIAAASTVVGNIPVLVASVPAAVRSTLCAQCSARWAPKARSPDGRRPLIRRCVRSGLSPADPARAAGVRPSSFRRSLHVAAEVLGPTEPRLASSPGPSGFGRSPVRAYLGGSR